MIRAQSARSSLIVRAGSWTSVTHCSAASVAPIAVRNAGAGDDGSMPFHTGAPVSSVTTGVPGGRGYAITSAAIRQSGTATGR